MDGWEYSTQMYLLIELDYSYKAINKNKIKNFRRFGLKQKPPRPSHGLEGQIMRKPIAARRLAKQFSEIRHAFLVVCS